MSQRCAWTNEEAENLKEVVLVVPNRVGTHPRPKTFYVLPQYEADLRRFTEYTRRFALVFVFTILGLSIALPIVAALGRYSLAGALVGVTGVLIIVFPFATPETVNSLGIRTSIRIVRALGLLVVALGSYLAFKP